MLFLAFLIEILAMYEIAYRIETKIGAVCVFRTGNRIFGPNFRVPDGSQRAVSPNGLYRYYPGSWPDESSAAFL